MQVIRLAFHPLLPMCLPHLTLDCVPRLHRLQLRSPPPLLPLVGRGVAWGWEVEDSEMKHEALTVTVAVPHATLMGHSARS